MVQRHNKPEDKAVAVTIGVDEDAAGAEMLNLKTKNEIKCTYARSHVDHRQEYARGTAPAPAPSPPSPPSPPTLIQRPSPPPPP